MSLGRYGVLVGRPFSRRLGTIANPHYQIQVFDETYDYRVAVNVKSEQFPSEVEYVIDDNFRHPVTDGLLELSPGLHRLPTEPGGLALDYIRGNLFDRHKMKPLPFDLPGPDNDLNEFLDRYIEMALRDETALLFAYGSSWGPERKRDKIFGFRPGQGVHDIHMNQGNSYAYRGQDAIYQDGALLLYFPSRERWVAIFLKFQSQSWHTDDRTGHRIEPSREVYEESSTVISGEPDYMIRIVAALVHPGGPNHEPQTVTLLNPSDRAVDLAGWSIADRLKNQFPLKGDLLPGETRTFRLSQPFHLDHRGGLITLLDKNNLKVHGVAYTAAQAGRKGWTIVFPAE